ncbi:MAG: UDP-N-acetylmuramate dehydrogenase [Eubacteriales bacterium]
MTNKLFLKSFSELGVKVLKDVPMSKHTTFCVGGTADYMIFPKNTSELINTLNNLKKSSISYYIIGKGSNLLVTDKGIRGAVIKLSDNFSDISFNGDIALASSGALLGELLRDAHKNGLCGMEALGGIPGTIGGAVVMNAGAYGSEISDFILNVRAVDESGSIVTLDKDSLELGYRTSSILSKKLIVIDASFKLKSGDIITAKKLLSGYNKKRHEKQPLDFPSAGSTFKRPKGYFAGTLIESAGLKGFSIGGAQVSEKHAGFIINTGKASAYDVIALIEHVRKTVFDKFGVDLEPEVKIIGEP